MKTKLTVVVLAALVTSAANSEIEKLASPGSKGIDLVWWPKLAVPKGWHRDMNVSYANKAIFLLADGKSFATARSVIYAKANYPKKVSLDKFIQDDIESFKKENPSVVVTSAKSYRTAGGKVLKAYDFTRKGCSERLAYGAEGEYLTLFCISAKNSADLKKDLPTFEWVLSRYR